MRVAKKSREKIAKDLLKLARPIDRFKVDPDNARVHDRASIEAIKFSLRKFGQQKAIVYDPKTGTVTAGNGTIIAARELGWRRIAASSYDGPGAARDFAVADNATQDLSRFDPDRLHVALKRFDLPALEVLGLKAMAPMRVTVGDGGGGDDEGENPGRMPSGQTEHVRTVQLFFSVEQHEEFNKRTLDLATKYKTGNVTDTVLEALRRVK